MRSWFKSRRPPTIVLRVATLVAVAVIPVLVFSGYMLIHYSTEQRDRYLLQLQATARAVSLAIDGKIQEQQGITSALLATRVLRLNDWQGVHEVASLAVADQPGAWVAVYDPSGQFITSTDVPFGTEFPVRTAVPDIVQQAVETRHRVVSGLATRRLDGTKFVGVFTPVIESGTVTHVIAVALPAVNISEALRERPMAVGGISAVIDQNGILIARSVAEEEFVGHPAAAGLTAAMSGREEGIYEARSLEGVLLHGAFAKSPVTGWTVALGLDDAALHAPGRLALMQFGGGGVVLLLVPLALAVYHGRRVARPVVALSRMADALGRGEPIRDEPLYFVEAQNTAQRLREVAAALQERTSERERIAEAVRRDRDLLVYYAISSAAEQTLELQERLEMLLRAASESTGLEAGAIYILDAAGEPLLRASVGCSAALVNDLHVGLDEELPATIGAKMTTLVFDAADCPTPRLRSILERERFQSLVGVPLLADVRLVGVLLLATGNRREFLPDEVDLLNAVGHQLGMFIDHARLYEATRRELAEREMAQAQLETAHKDLESFSYSVSHDLRAPLRAIDGFSRILVEDYADKLDVEGKRVINVVRESTARMTRMIDDILAFSRVGRVEMRVAPVDMLAAVKAAIRDLEPVIADRQIDFEIGELPQAQGDAGMLQQVWANLIGNAVKYTGPRELAVIQIMAEQREDETIYLVRDNGVGFDMQYADRLCGAFERLHGSEFPGTGIGLSIVKRIITRHGGRIWAEGKIENGAAFFFTLGDNGQSVPASDRRGMQQSAVVT